MEKFLKLCIDKGQKKNDLRIALERAMEQNLDKSNEVREFLIGDSYAMYTVERLKTHFEACAAILNYMNSEMSEKIKEEDRKLSKVEKDNLLRAKKNI